MSVRGVGGRPGADSFLLDDVDDDLRDVGLDGVSPGFVEDRAPSAEEEAEGVTGGGYAPFRERTPPLPEAPRSCWSRWKWRVASLTGSGLSLGLYLLDYGRVSNIIGLTGLGAGLHAAITSGHDNDQYLRIRQATTTAFGQASLFALTSVYFNVAGSAVHKGIVRAIMCMLGVNYESDLHWLWRKGGVNREESHELAEATGDRFKRVGLVNEKTAWVLKAGTTALSLVLSQAASDEEMRDLFWFITWFYPGQVVGEVGMQALDLAIARLMEKSEQPKCFTLRRLRMAKDFFTTASRVSIPFLLVPYTRDWSHHLGWVGALLGLSDGIMGESKRKRFEEVPIQALEELREIKTSPYLEWGVPVAATGALAGFTAWQVGWKLETSVEKIALLINLFAFGSMLVFAKRTDATWSRQRPVIGERSNRHDWSMYHVTISPRILGMNPFYFYFAMTNCFDMSSKGIKEEKNELHLALILAAWAAYGIAMAQELHMTTSRRIKGYSLSFPQMVLANALLMTHLYRIGVID